MRLSFEGFLNEVIRVAPRRVTFNLNSSSVYMDGAEISDPLEKIWERFGLEEGEGLEVMGKAYDGKRVKSSFYASGVAVHLKRPLRWHRKEIEAFAVLYQSSTVVLLEGRERKVFRGGFEERGRAVLHGWEFKRLMGGKVFYKRVGRATRRFAITPRGFFSLSHPKGYNLLLLVEGDVGLRDALRGFVRSLEGFRNAGEGYIRLGNYIVKALGDELLIVHEERAKFRILYESFLAGKSRRKKLLVPVELGDVDVHSAGALKRLGFVIREGFLVEVPEFLGFPQPAALKSLLKAISGVERFETLAMRAAEILLSSFTVSPSELILRLMLCNNPYQDPTGKVVLRKISREDLEEMLP